MPVTISQHCRKCGKNHTVSFDAKSKKKTVEEMKKAEVKLKEQVVGCKHE